MSHLFLSDEALLGDLLLMLDFPRPLQTSLLIPYEPVLLLEMLIPRMPNKPMFPTVLELSDGSLFFGNPICRAKLFTCSTTSTLCIRPTDFILLVK